MNPLDLDYRVSALVVGALAVHPALGSEGQTITHRKTGMALGTLKGSEDLAVAIAKRTNALGGWNRTAVELYNDKDLFDEIRKIFKEELKLFQEARHA